MTRTFECFRCFHKWNSQSATVTCPACSHLYCRWTNYEDTRTRFHDSLALDSSMRCFGPDKEAYGGTPDLYFLEAI